MREPEELRRIDPRQGQQYENIPDLGRSHHSISGSAGRLYDRHWG
jgi:hypothetical protein